MKRGVIWFGLNLLLLISVAWAQDDALCPVIVQQALTRLADNCGNLGRNTACYGANRLTTTFFAPMPTNFFTLPSEKADLLAIQKLQTAPLDLVTQEWGIGVLNVQANVPEALPGQAVTFLLLGDTTVENAVQPASATLGAITAITSAAGISYAQPTTAAPVLETVVSGTVLTFDRLSADQSWLHIENGGWIERGLISQTPALARLPLEGETRQTPMQAFYLRGGLGGAACSDAPSVLAIRSPENIHVDLTANGAHIRLGSLVLLQNLGDVLQLTTLEGAALLEPATPQEQRVPAGYTTRRCLKPAENLGMDGQANDQEIDAACGWEQPFPTPPDLLGLGGATLTVFRELGQSVQPLQPPAPECASGQTLQHVVEAGENLFRISTRYQTSMGAIMQANALTDPQLIYSGQTLVIPCGQQTPLPTPDPHATPFVPAGSAQCAPFRATSPLDGLAYGMNTFYWDAAPGATHYRVNIYSIDEQKGALVGSYQTSGAETNLSANLTVDTVGYGFSFAWNVQALVNGQVLCSTPQVTIPRAAGTGGGSQPAQPPAAPTAIIFNASWKCVTAGAVEVLYSGVPLTDTSVTISFINSLGAPTGGTFAITGGSGSQVFTPVGDIANAVLNSAPSGAHAFASPVSLTC